MDLRGWVNDGLITVFFLTVGLELKRELVVGELRDLRTAALPIIAAGGGMVGSALVYVAFTAGSPSVHGWGIPMATDLALALGVLSLLGNRVSSSVKLFVLALAVADDLGSIVVLAIFYQHDFSWVPLVVAIGLIGVAVGLRALKVSWMPLYVAIGLALWLALYKAGISPTLAGVAMGLLATTRPHLSSRRARSAHRRAHRRLLRTSCASHDPDRARRDADRGTTRARPPSVVELRRCPDLRVRQRRASRSAAGRSLTAE